MKRWFLVLFFVCQTLWAFSEDITGFWQTMSDTTGKPTSIIAVYQYQEKYYGKLIATFNDDGSINETMKNPKSRATGVVGDPYLCGLDIVYNAEPNRGGTKCSGYVVDPKKGRVYDAELWRRKENLILRGKLFIFGKNITWPPFPENQFSNSFPKPDLATFVPNIPKVK